MLRYILDRTWGALVLCALAVVVANAKAYAGALAVQLVQLNVPWLGVWVATIGLWSGTPWVFSGIAVAIAAVVCFQVLRTPCTLTVRITRIIVQTNEKGVVPEAPLAVLSIRVTNHGPIKTKVQDWNANIPGVAQGNGVRWHGGDAYAQETNIYVHEEGGIAYRDLISARLEGKMLEPEDSENGRLIYTFAGVQSLSDFNTLNVSCEDSRSNKSRLDKKREVAPEGLAMQRRGRQSE